MVEMLIFASRKQEASLLEQYAREYAARFTEETWHYVSCAELANLKSFVDTNPLLDMVCADITVEGVIGELIKLRRENRHAYITLIAGTKMSPAVYMRPQIMASSLLLKPLTKQQLTTVLCEAFASFALRFSAASPKEQFVVETKAGKYFVEYGQILFFEAREKKLFLITQTKEIAFYGTVGELCKQLPGSFCRCHRSFLVNMDRVQELRSGEGMLVLDNGDVLPVSRSYRNELKEFWNESAVE